MSNILKPWAEIFEEDGIGSLARDVNANVSTAKDILRIRGQRGVIARHPVGNHVQSSKLVAEAIVSRDVTPYAIIAPDTGRNVGSAALLANLKLYENDKLLIPTSIARRTNVETLSKINLLVTNNVFAWTIPDFEDLLLPAYQELLALHESDQTDLLQCNPAAKMLKEVSGEEIIFQATINPAWTVEPVRTPSFVKDSLLKAGFVNAQTARFDDGELGLIPYPTPRSNLYLGPRPTVTY